jgi:hypothetical protein
LSLLWLAKSDREPVDLPRSAWFPGEVPVASRRSSWDDPDAWYFATKGGNNQVNHGHLDLGSFVLEGRGVRWALDLGIEDYNLPNIFDRQPGSMRWSYFRISSRSHNVPQFGDDLQNALGRASLAVQEKDDTWAVEVELSDAYGEHVESCIRNFVTGSGENFLPLTIQDRFCLRDPGRYAWQMLTEAAVSLADAQTAVLQCRGQTITLFFEASLPFHMEVAPATPPTDAEAQNDGVSLLRVNLELGDTLSGELSIRFAEI